MAQDENLETHTEAFKELTIIELSEFVKLFEETFEISSSAAIAKSSYSGTGRSLPDLKADLLGSFRAYLTARIDKAVHGGAEARSDTADRLIMAAVNMERSVEALGPALAAVESPVSPQLARSAQATENAWRKIAEEFGLLSSVEVSMLVGSKAPNRSYASDQHAKGRLIAVKRPNGLKYPGFQFDRQEHAIRPVFEGLIHAAAEAGWSEASLALWMVSPSGYLDGARPVDRLSQPEAVLGAARQSFNVQW